MLIYKCFQNFSKVFDEYIVPFLNRNFGDAIAVQDLRGIHILYISVQNFVRCFPPNQNPGAANVHYSLYMKRKGVPGALFLGGPEAVPLLSANRAGPGTVYLIKLYNTVFISVMYLLYCNSSYYYIYINFNFDILPCLFDSIIKLF